MAALTESYSLQTLRQMDLMDTAIAEFCVDTGPHMITGYGIPEGENVCIEVKVCDEWYPWKCPGCTCKITNRALRGFN